MVSHKYLVSLEPTISSCYKERNAIWACTCGLIDHPILLEGGNTT